MVPPPVRRTRRQVILLTTVVAIALLAGTVPSRAADPAARAPAAARALGVASTHPNRFVRRAGSQVQVAGKPWRFAGVNMYWLGLDENVTDRYGPTYPSHAAVDSGMRAAVAAGATLVRSTTLGVSVGSRRSLEPVLGHFNRRAFAGIDYAVAAARRFGLRLMIPLTDEWHYYDGGKHTFTNWVGFHDLRGQSVVTSTAQRDREAEFYTDPTVVSAFDAYVHHLLGHRNPLTGLRLGADPTIAIWETGNELWDAPPAWTERTAAFIKTQAPNALVADGSAASGKLISETALAAPDVDVIDGHFYPIDTAKALHDADAIAAHGKAYVIGEYPLGGPRVAEWLARLANDPDVSGDLAWSLLPWLPDGSAEQHDDGYTFHYPGATPAEQAEDAVLRVHTTRMRQA